MSVMDANFRDLKKITAKCCEDGNWNYSEYHFGLANGMILALAIMSGDEPVYMTKPERFLNEREKFQQEQPDLSEV